MVKNKVMQTKGKPAKITVAKLKAPQLKALQYLLAASAYVSIIQGSARRKKTQKENMETSAIFTLISGSILSRTHQFDCHRLGITMVTAKIT